MLQINAIPIIIFSTAIAPRRWLLYTQNESTALHTKHAIKTYYSQARSQEFAMEGGNSGVRPRPPEANDGLGKNLPAAGAGGLRAKPPEAGGFAVFLIK